MVYFLNEKQSKIQFIVLPSHFELIIVIAIQLNYHSVYVFTEVTVNFRPFFQLLNLPLNIFISHKSLTVTGENLKKTYKPLKLTNRHQRNSQLYTVAQILMHSLIVIKLVLQHLNSHFVTPTLTFTILTVPLQSNQSYLDLNIIHIIVSNVVF